MTDATARTAGFMSVAGIGSKMATVGFALWALGKIAGILVTIGAVFAADTYVGGVLLVDMLSGSTDSHAERVGWLASIATSGILTVLWGVVFAKKWIGWLMLTPALVLAAADAVVDARYPTLQLYGHDVVMNSGLIPPQIQFVWVLLEVIFTTITLFGEPIITLLFAYLFLEIKKMFSGEGREPLGEKPGAPSTAPSLASV